MKVHCRSLQPEHRMQASLRRASSDLQGLPSDDAGRLQQPLPPGVEEGDMQIRKTGDQIILEDQFSKFGLGINWSYNPIRTHKAVAGGKFQL